jgi:hypothetical protein
MSSGVPIAARIMGMGMMILADRTQTTEGDEKKLEAEI